MTEEEKKLDIEKKKFEVEEVPPCLVCGKKGTGKTKENLGGSEE